MPVTTQAANDAMSYLNMSNRMRSLIGDLRKEHSYFVAVDATQPYIKVGGSKVDISKEIATQLEAGMEQAMWFIVNSLIAKAHELTGEPPAPADPSVGVSVVNGGSNEETTTTEPL